MTPGKFQEIEKLYHYTPLKNGLLILLSGKIIMSNPSRMNDINESYRPMYCSGCEIDEAEAEILKYHQRIFTIDDGRIPGFAIPALWGHYADKGMGMCLVFDKLKLTSRLNGKAWSHGEIKYDSVYDSSIIIEGNPKEYIEKNIQNVFFTKSSDWSYEREYRLLCRADVIPVEIDIAHAIVAVIVYRFSDIPREDSPISSVTYRTLMKTLNKMQIPILIFGLSTLNGRYELYDFESNTDGIRWFPYDTKSST